MNSNFRKKVALRMEILKWDYADLTEAYNRLTGENISQCHLEQIAKTKRPSIKYIVIFGKIFQVTSEYWGFGKGITALIDAGLEIRDVARIMKKSIANVSLLVTTINKKGGLGVGTDSLYCFATATGKPMVWFFD